MLYLLSLPVLSFCSIDGVVGIPVGGVDGPWERRRHASRPRVRSLQREGIRTHWLLP